ncbi:MAG TPA: anti-sigma factor [Mycobacteriales bacterium]|nr:anti-sigma factor [Mycobacteriales bacterium]
MTTGHGQWEELAAGHALNALEPEEEHAFLDHLRGCDRCRRDLAALREVAGEMAWAAEPAEPPAALGRRIMEAAAAERPAPFAPAAPRALRQRRVWQPTVRPAMLATAAAVVAALGLATWNLALRADNAAKRDALGRRTAALSCLAAPETRKFELRSPNEPRGAACLAGDRAYLVVDRMEPNDAARSVYVLWWQDAKAAMHPVERFDVTGTRAAVFELPLTVAPADVRAVAVSLEPGRGLPSVPTRQIASGAAVG